MSFPCSDQEGSDNMSRELPAWMQPSGEPDWSSRNNPWDTSRSGAPNQSPERPDSPSPSELTLRPLILTASEGSSPEVSNAAEALLLLALNAVGSLAEKTLNATDSPTEESGVEAEDSVEEASSYDESQIKWTAINDGDSHMAETSASADEDLVEASTDDGQDLMDREASDDKDILEAPEKDGEYMLQEEADDDEDPAEGAGGEDDSPKHGDIQPGKCKDCSVPVEGGNHRCPDCKKKHNVVLASQARNRRKQKGMCYTCGRAKSIEKALRCERCITAARARAKAMYSRAKKENKCGQCKKRDAQDGESCCARCTANKRAGRDRARSQGKCIRCWRNEAMDGGSTCAECRMYRQELRRQHCCEMKEKRAL